mmetsp:Transcript_35807/g.91464  ORF Transcript_35807/g.91464 Transcript_35807/m.91464 type:complete len:229 (+) Transcript_35807:1614-2300(+)
MSKLESKLRPPSRMYTGSAYVSVEYTLWLPVPVPVQVPGSSGRFRTPAKSASLACRFPSSRMFDGLTSRWQNSCTLWSSANGRSTSTAMRIRYSQVNLTLFPLMSTHPFLSAFSTSPPSAHSSTRARSSMQTPRSDTIAGSRSSFKPSSSTSNCFTAVSVSSVRIFTATGSLPSISPLYTLAYRPSPTGCDRFPVLESAIMNSTSSFEYSRRPSFLRCLRVPAVADVP